MVILRTTIQAISAAVSHPHGLTMFSPVSLGTTPLSQSWGPAPVLAMTAVPTGNLKGFVCRHDLKPVGQPCDQPPCVSPSNAPRRRFYTQAFLHADAFTHKHFHRRVYKQRLLHTDAFTHRRFYTQMLLHTHTHFHTQRLLHTEAFEECLYMTFYGPELKLFCF